MSEESIGSVTLAEDGTLILMLRATGPEGAVGDARLTYTEENPRYTEILKHVGGLQPGESKPVPPWPDPA